MRSPRGRGGPLEGAGTAARHVGAPGGFLEAGDHQDGERELAASARLATWLQSAKAAAAANTWPPPGRARRKVAGGEQRATPAHLCALGSGL